MVRHHIAARLLRRRAELLAGVFTAALTVTLSFEPFAASAATPLQLHGALQRENSIGIVSHRGAAALAPENTLAAFRLAIDLGVDFIETDVQLTADGVPVLMHDPRLDRTTNGSGRLITHTYEQVRALDAGSWFGPEFAGEPVPTFYEFAELLSHAPTRAFVEVKHAWGEQHIAALIDTLRSHHLTQRVVLASFERESLEMIRAQGPELATILLTRELDESVVQYAIAHGMSAVCARSKLFASAKNELAQLDQAGIGTIAYTLNTAEQWQTAAELEVDFFVTDDPVALAAWRDDKGTP